MKIYENDFLTSLIIKKTVYSKQLFKLSVHLLTIAEKNFINSQIITSPLILQASFLRLRKRKKKDHLKAKLVLLWLLSKFDWHSYFF